MNLPAESKLTEDTPAEKKEPTKPRPVSFRCVCNLGEAVRRLTHATRPTAVFTQLADNDPARHVQALRGEVSERRVKLAYGGIRKLPLFSTHFAGEWKQGPDGLRLEGEIRPPQIINKGVLGAVATLLWVFLWAMGVGGWRLAVGYGVAASIVVPMAVKWLGAIREAEEKELVRAIGVAIGDPNEYAPRPARRWIAD